MSARFSQAGRSPLVCPPCHNERIFASSAVTSAASVDAALYWLLTLDKATDAYATSTTVSGPVAGPVTQAICVVRALKDSVWYRWLVLVGKSCVL
jgi:hypothetical protein